MIPAVGVGQAKGEGGEGEATRNQRVMHAMRPLHYCRHRRHRRARDGGTDRGATIKAERHGQVMPEAKCSQPVLAAKGL